MNDLQKDWSEILEEVIFDVPTFEKTDQEIIDDTIKALALKLLEHTQNHYDFQGNQHGECIPTSVIKSLIEPPKVDKTRHYKRVIGGQNE